MLGQIGSASTDRPTRSCCDDQLNPPSIPHSATAAAGEEGKWDTGLLAKGESKTITFDVPGVHYYICTPHPWMYGQVIVEK